jgi:hypothetical protein
LYPELKNPEKLERQIRAVTDKTWEVDLRFRYPKLKIAGVTGIGGIGQASLTPGSGQAVPTIYSPRIIIDGREVRATIDDSLNRASQRDALRRLMLESA